MHRFADLCRLDKVSFAATEFGRILLCHQIFPLREFHLAQIDDIVISGDTQIYLRLLYTFVGIAYELENGEIIYVPE